MYFIRYDSDVIYRVSKDVPRA